jgi:hypothetical protein
MTAARIPLYQGRTGMIDYITLIDGGRILHKKSEDAPCRGDKGPIHSAEPLVPYSNSFEVEIPIVKLEIYKPPDSDRISADSSRRSNIMLRKS